MDAHPESTEDQEMKPENRSEKLSPGSIAAIQGRELNEETGLEKSDQDQSDQDQPDSYQPPLEDATIHPNPKGPEHLPSPETEPISFKTPSKGVEEEGDSIDSEEKNHLNPPEGWRPGGPEGGG
jgi:hypothetical protein